MRLYQGCTQANARHILHHGFVGELWMPLKEDRKSGIVRDEAGEPVLERKEPEGWCVFRSGSFAAGDGQEEDARLVVIPEGDLVVMIDVPEDVAKRYEVVERPERHVDEHDEVPPVNREFWLTPEVANRFLETLKIYDRDGAEIRRDLVGK